MRYVLAILGGVLVGACNREPDTSVTWSAPETTSAPTVVGAAPMFAVSPGGTRVIAWVSAPDAGTDGRLYVRTGASAPVELRDSLGPIEPHGEAPPKLTYAPDGTLYALYAVVRVEKGRRFPFATLRLTASRDDGRTWSAPATVTGDSVPGSRNFHALHAAPNGTVFVSWLESQGAKSAAYLTRTTDAGASWAPLSRIDPGEACPCCRTGIATAPDGSMFVAWRSVLPGNVRDVVVARSSDGGSSWSEPVRVHADDWVFDGCPHAGPSIQVDSAGALHVAWWTGKEGSAGVYYARSSDGGRTFSKPVALGVAQFSQPAHVQLAVAKGTIAAVWDDGTLKSPRVVVRISSDAGATFGAPVTLSNEGTVASFPVLALTGDGVTVAWSEHQLGTGVTHDQHGSGSSDPNTPQGLPSVGQSHIVVRAGTFK